MSNSGGLKELAQFTNRERDIGSCIGKILKFTNGAAVKRWLIEEFTVMGGQFVAKAHGVGHGFAYSIFVIFKRPVAYLEWH